MSEQSYDFADVPESSAGLLHRQIEDAGFGPTLLRVDEDGSDMLVVFDTALSTGEEATLDGFVADLSLTHAKIDKHAAIDLRSRQLIAEGHPYPTDDANPSTTVAYFSLSDQAQRNLLGMAVSAASLEYPVEINSLDNSTTRVLADATDVYNFYGNAVLTIRSILDGGTSLKKTVTSATTIAEVDAVVDNR